MLSFGRFEPFVDPVDAMQRSLWLVFAGIFVTVAFIARNVWSQVRPLLEGRSAPSHPGATLKTRVGSALMKVLVCGATASSAATSARP
jgi:predicted membrane metal-binding protein